MSKIHFQVEDKDHLSYQYRILEFDSVEPFDDFFTGTLSSCVAKGSCDTL